MSERVQTLNISTRLRDLARDVRRIGNGYRCDPEAIAIRKDEIAKKLAAIARELERAA